jgi:hypothetical protein
MCRGHVFHAAIRHVVAVTIISEKGPEARIMASVPNTLTSISRRIAASEPSANIELISMTPTLLISRSLGGNAR